MTYPSNEYKLLSGLREILSGLPQNNYEVGIGDDAAVRRCAGDERLIFTTDIAVENVDFKTEYMSFSEIGYRAMVSNLSDCAAMGAVPDSALVQLTFPTDCSGLEKSIKELYNGFATACRRWEFPIVGGDLSSGPVWAIGITLIGKISTEKRVLKRTGIQNGDSLWVTGTPGLSGAGLTALLTWGRERSFSGYPLLISAHITPTPRIEFGNLLLENGLVHAMMDLSDGLSKDCRTLAYDNNLGVVLFSNPSQIPGEMIKLSSELGIPWENWYFHGGEEYELLFAAAPSFDPSVIPGAGQFIRIGYFTDEFPDVLVEKDNLRSPLNRGSFDHITCEK